VPATLGSPWAAAGFVAVVLALLVVDLGVLRKKPREIGAREALLASAGWIALALAFAGYLYARHGERPALEFLTGYVIEKALSVDNVFVILVTLTSFAVPAALWHRVLALGIVGALVMRGALILAGTSLLHAVHATTYVFGGILVLTAIRMLTARDEPAPGGRPSLGVLGRWIPSVGEYRGAAFFVREGARWCATPLFFALVTVEIGDVIFAADSIPAIFAVTTDPFLVFTSNVFAILGLRSLFFALRGLVERFHYLKAGVSLVLLFVGAKMLIAGVLVVPIGASLAVIAGLLGGAALASTVRERRLVREGAAS
jgi:tellurite resistance protein TerC